MQATSQGCLLAWEVHETTQSQVRQSSHPALAGLSPEMLDHVRAAALGGQHLLS